MDARATCSWALEQPEVLEARNATVLCTKLREFLAVNVFSSTVNLTKRNEGSGECDLAVDEFIILRICENGFHFTVGFQGFGTLVFPSKQIADVVVGPSSPAGVSSGDVMLQGLLVATEREVAIPLFSAHVRH